MNSTLTLISGLGLGLGLETSGLGLEALGLETPGLDNIPAFLIASSQLHKSPLLLNN